MKLRAFKSIPVLIAFCVIALVCLLRWLNLDFSERLERMTFDMRARAAFRSSPPAATNLGFVFINEESVKAVADRSLGFRFGLQWPRQVYGRLVHELALQGAKAVGLDIIFGELRPDHGFVILADGSLGPDSDEFFAAEARSAGNVIIAITPEVTPPSLFLTNAAGVGDIFADKDPDGILRRACAFRVYRDWHSAFKKLESDPDYGVDLNKARIEPRQIVLPRTGVEEIKVPLDAEGNFDLADFGGNQIPMEKRKAKPFTLQRIWHMGIVLAARELNLDLEHAEVDLPHGRITLHGPGDVRRVIPVDKDGFFFIDWSLAENDRRLTFEPIQALLLQAKLRLEGQTNGLTKDWAGRLAVVGSSALVGNNLTDRGATPLSKDTLLVSKHWNVANSLLMGRFVQRTSLGTDLALIAFLAIVAAAVTWRLRVLVASGIVALVLVLYSAIAVGVYVNTRFWIPIFLPLVGGLLMSHVSLVTWRVVFEQDQRRRIKSVFSTLVSPKIVNELLKNETLSWEGARREITILFADVRGFTELTDSGQERVAEFVRQNKLTGLAAEACYDNQARETLNTVNVYLGLVADTVLQHDGTLDKFIGDCVMAFWGAPTPNPHHASACVRMAIQAQRAIYELNLHRQEENKKIEQENRSRIAAGTAPKPLLPVLLLGTGINTGTAIVGLMGAGSKTVVRQGSYTVFGREVNLASRLEGASGRGHIYISQSAYEHLQKDDPVLAGTCMPLPDPLTLKGFRTPIQVYEVPWHAPESKPPAEKPIPALAADNTPFAKADQPKLSSR